MSSVELVTRTYQNPASQDYRHPQHSTQHVQQFHQQLAMHNVTKLQHLPKAVFQTQNVFLKDESTRFGLPAFKILGATYAIHKTLTSRLGLPFEATEETVSKAANASQLEVITSSAGNWGRAVAKTCSLYKLRARIFVPSTTPESTVQLIVGESIAGTNNIACSAMPADKGTYEDSLDLIRQLVREDPSHRVLAMDTSWDGYSEFPALVTEGYSTMLTEVTVQLEDTLHGVSKQPDYLVMSVGVGSWAHACVTYYSSLTSNIKRPIIISVEPENATCLLTSLTNSKMTRIETKPTIMNGMNCGEVSSIAWPVLQAGVDIAVAVSDLESHECVIELKDLGFDVGPCGAATLAALRKVIREGRIRPSRDDCVVLFSTEGMREYQVPQ